jgi:ATP-dependent RNA helicase DHX33
MEPFLIGLPEDTVPEIQRCHLSSVVLQLLALGVSNVMTFDFMSPPPQESLLGAVEHLYLLGAVEEEEEEEDDGEDLMKEGKEELSSKRGYRSAPVGIGGGMMEEDEDYGLQLTALGQTMSHFPLEPFLARAIVTSPKQGCVHEVLSVVAMLSVDSVVFMPHDKREQVVFAHRKFLSRDGDHMTLLNMFRAYKSVKGNKVGGGGWVGGWSRVVVVVF